MSQVRTCDECACGIVNDDWTHLDAQCCCNTAENNGHKADCEAERLHATVTGTLEILGWLTLAGKSEDGGCFDCAICSDIQYGGGSLFSGVSS